MHLHQMAEPDSSAEQIDEEDYYDDDDIDLYDGYGEYEDYGVGANSVTGY